MTDHEIAVGLEAPASRTRAAKAIVYGMVMRRRVETHAIDVETAWECVGAQTRELAFAHVDAIVAAFKDGATPRKGAR